MRYHEGASEGQFRGHAPVLFHAPAALPTLLFTKAGATLDAGRMSTTEPTASSLPPSNRPRVLTPEEADMIADSIRPSWEPPAPSTRLGAAAPPVEPAGTDAMGSIKNGVEASAPPSPAAKSGNKTPAATVHGAPRPTPSDADRTLTNDELRSIERKRRRTVPEGSYREERSASAPPERVEQSAPAASIIVDPVVLAAPPPQFAASPRVPSNLSAAAAFAAPSADATVVIPPVNVDHLRPKRAGAFIGFGAVAALIAGGVYFLSTQHEPATAPPPNAAPVIPTQPAVVQAAAQATTPQSAAPQPEPPPTSTAAAPPEPIAKAPDPPKKPFANGYKHDAVLVIPPGTAPKQPPKPPAATGGDKGKLVRDVPF